MTSELRRRDAYHTPEDLREMARALGFKFVSGTPSEQAARFMASTDQVIQAIRFAFETLGERNAQHEFEHLCRHFARARVCFHILPATGPVSGGGDQGRDFETFRTFIHELGSPHFCAVADAKRIAFASSLEKKVVAKVKSDVAKIVGGGVRPDLIYFFSSRPVSVSDRHKLQEWARTRHAVELEILDCVALAEQLADPDVFWIAARYLQVSPEIYPRPSDAGSAYDRLAAKWLAAERAAERFADFIEIKRAARIALGSAPQDLPRWLALLAAYEAQCEGNAERHQVQYELLALTMRERRSLRGDEERVRSFFSDPELLELPDTATHAETIHCYVATAQLLGEADLTSQELENWHDTILRATEAGIAQPASDNQLCLWLELRGSIELHAQLRSGRLDLAACVAPWIRLTESLPDAPMFPVQEFHDLIVRFAEEMEDPPVFDDLLNRARPFLAERAGATALAESHFRRAQHFLDIEQIPRALRELHSARLKWFGHETIGEAAHCCLLLSRCYHRLGLHIAAIYYALIASFIFANAANVSLHEHVHEGLHDAAEAAYAQGLWCLFFELAGSALKVQFHTSTAGLNVDESPYLEWLLQNLPPALHATRKLVPPVFDVAMREFRACGMESILLEGMEAFEAAAAKWSDGDFEIALRNSFTGPPFSDAGQNCEAMWSAFGVRWRLRWPNDYAPLRVSLEVVAFLQIAISELAGSDLDIIPGTLLAEIELTDDASVSAEPVPDNSVCRWSFRVPRAPLRGTDGVEEFRYQMLTCFVKIVSSLSAMPDEQFIEIFRREVAPHLFAHDFFARRLPELLDFFAGRERFGAVGRRDCAAPLDAGTWESPEVKALSWVKTPHPKYDEAIALQQVRRRYEVSLAGLCYTLPRVMADPAFQETVAALRTDGWKDWHVLVAMLNAVANYRVNRRIDARANEERYAEAMKDKLFSPEKPESPPVPTTHLTRELLRMHLLMALNSGLSSEGLQFHHRTPNIDSIFNYARHRWRYFDLDVEHPDIFATTSV